VARCAARSRCTDVGAASGNAGGVGATSRRADIGYGPDRADIARAARSAVGHASTARGIVNDASTVRGIVNDASTVRGNANHVGTPRTDAVYSASAQGDAGQLCSTSGCSADPGSGGRGTDASAALGYAGRPVVRHGATIRRGRNRVTNTCTATDNARELGPKARVHAAIGPGRSHGADTRAATGNAGVPRPTA
jgi:hypothetical protein